MNAILTYMIATHGPRTLHKRHPALRQQVANLRAYAAQNDADMRFCHDYARRVLSISDLPVLQKFLSAAAEHDGRLLMDDLSRLFRPCAGQIAREQLACDLEPFASCLFGLRQGMSFADLPSVNRDLVVSAALSSKFVLAPTPRARRLEEDLKDQTEAANKASASARRNAADTKARELCKIRDDLATGHEHVTNKMIADRANETGLRTTRRGPWRPDTVARALKRLNIDER